jgi:hypothetical protein
VQNAFLEVQNVYLEVQNVYLEVPDVPVLDASDPVRLLLKLVVIDGVLHPQLLSWSTEKKSIHGLLKNEFFCSSLATGIHLSLFSCPNFDKTVYSTA